MTKRWSCDLNLNGAQKVIGFAFKNPTEGDEMIGFDGLLPTGVFRESGGVNIGRSRNLVIGLGDSHALEHEFGDNDTITGDVLSHPSPLRRNSSDAVRRGVRATGIRGKADSRAQNQRGTGHRRHESQLGHPPRSPERGYTYTLWITRGITC